MARWSTVQIGELDPPLILSPERYDPLRQAASRGVPLTEIVSFPREAVGPAKGPRDRHFLLVDTGDAQEGVLRSTGRVVLCGNLGSTKRVAKTGDVIISRLRPYLRQVAYVDPGVSPLRDVDLACSTEFYVLRSHDDSSIAFLAAFLLSETPQAVFSASQEGGHHPRFSQQTLASIRVPEEVLKIRDELSSRVAQAVAAARESEAGIVEAIDRCSRASGHAQQSSGGRGHST